MKKIAIIMPETLPLPAVRGGAVENLTQFFIENNEQDKLVDLTVFSLYDDLAVKESKRFKNTEFVFLKSNVLLNKFTYYFNRFLFKYLTKLKLQIFPYINNAIKRINSSDYDYILVENRPAFVPYIGKRCDIPIILHLHNDSLNSSTYISEEICKFCYKILVVSDYLKECVKSINHEATNIITLKNVIDVNKFNDNGKIRSIYRNNYKIKDDEVLFMFSGRLVPEKGVKELLLAYKQLASKYDNVKLLIVGGSWFSCDNETDYVKEIKDIAKEFSDRIIFSGYIDYANIPPQYLCADVVVVPSQWEEVAGLVVIEGMASKNALIISDSGGMLEYTNQDCCVCVKRGNTFIDDLFLAMEKMVVDEKYRVKLSEYGVKYVESFDKSNYLKKLIDAMEVDT